ncbi:MAG: hypothetical protein M3P34_00900, partial [Actinomycetota bacterium]|nr:hypothetical protein [Actinomycetota bacterium]
RRDTSGSCDGFAVTFEDWLVTRTAEAQLQTAFPWGAHVTVESGSQFLSLRYEALTEDFGDDEVTLQLEREPGDTLQPVCLQKLKAAAAHWRAPVRHGRNRSPPGDRGSRPARRFVHWHVLLTVVP